MNIGLDVEKPSKTCSDSNCPWHGHLKVRGSILKGKIIKVQDKTAIFERRYYKYVPKYERYERRKTRLSVHRPLCIDVEPGDQVRIAECRPVSKTKSFVVIARC